MPRKKTTKPTVDGVLMELPSDNNILEAYIKRNKIDLTEKTLSSIEYAINNKLPFIEVFGFENSDFIIIVSEKEYLINVDNIYELYLEMEKYELCPRVIKLQNLLKTPK